MSPVPAPKYGYEAGVRDEILGGLKSDLFPLLSFLCGAYVDVPLVCVFQMGGVYSLMEAVVS